MRRIHRPMTVLVSTLALHLIVLTGRARCQQRPPEYPLRHVVNTVTGNWDRVPYNPFTGAPLAAGGDGVFFGAGGTAVSANGMLVTGLGAAGRRRGAAMGVNPYTADVASVAQGVNSAIGARDQVAGGYNPYTGGSAIAGRGYNPSTGNAGRGAAGYNPYTGDDVAAGQSYNARTRQSTSFAGSYNPMTGDGSYVGESTPGRRQETSR